MQEAEKNKERKIRYALLDSLRGAVLVSMMLFHGCWDLVYLFGKDWGWYLGTGAYIWQQSICWTFILLSGFCLPLGKKPFRRGLTVFLAGAAVSLVTALFMPEDRVLFGVLTLIGSCMLLAALLQGMLKKIPAEAGLLGSAFLFFLTRNINDGYLGFEKIDLAKLPEELYQGYGMTFLGFPDPAFYSTDYFSLFPWFFLFLTGYFLFQVLYRMDSSFLEKYCARGIASLSFLGRNSLLIYMLHQPLIYGGLLLLDYLR